MAILLLVLVTILLLLNTNIVFINGQESCASEENIEASIYPGIGLGSLWDQKNSVVNSGTFWLYDELRNKTNTKDVTEGLSNCYYAILESESKKMDLLNLGVSAKLDFSSGAVDLKLGVFKESAEKSVHETVFMKCEILTKSKSLEIDPKDASTSFDNRHLKTTATHVVTSVTYGYRGFFVFENRARQSSVTSEVLLDLDLVIKDLGTLDLFLKSKDVESDKYKDISFKYFGDVPIDVVGGSFENVKNAVKLFFENSKKINEGLGIVLKAHIVPLCKFTASGRLGSFLQNLNGEIFKKALTVYDNLNFFRSNTTLLRRNAELVGVQRIVTEMLDVAKYVAVYTGYYQKRLLELLPYLRSGTASLMELKKLLDSVQQSPFDEPTMKKYFEGKKSELTYYSTLRKNYADLNLGISVFSGPSAFATLFGPRELLNTTYRYYVLFVLVAPADIATNMPMRLGTYIDNPNGDQSIDLQQLEKNRWYNSYNDKHIGAQQALFLNFAKMAKDGKCFMNQNSTNDYIDKPLCDPKAQGFGFIEYKSYENQFKKNGIDLQGSQLLLFKNGQLVSIGMENCVSPSDPRSVYDGSCLWEYGQIPADRQCVYGQRDKPNEYQCSTFNATGFPRVGNMSSYCECTPRACVEQILCNDECVAEKEANFTILCTTMNTEWKKAQPDAAKIISLFEKIKIQLEAIFSARVKCPSNFTPIRNLAGYGEADALEKNITDAIAMTIRTYGCESSSDQTSSFTFLYNFAKEMYMKRLQRPNWPECLCKEIDACENYPCTGKNEYCVDKPDGYADERSCYTKSGFSVASSSSSSGRLLSKKDEKFHYKRRNLQEQVINVDACASNDACLKNFYCTDLPPPADGTTGKICTAHTTCFPGYYVSKTATKTSDNICSPCPAGTFQSSASFVGTSCNNITVSSCPDGQIMETAPSSTTDGHCLYCEPGEKPFCTAVDDGSPKKCWCIKPVVAIGDASAIATCDKACCQKSKSTCTTPTDLPFCACFVYSNVSACVRAGSNLLKPVCTSFGPEPDYSLWAAFFTMFGLFIFFSIWQFSMFFLKINGCKIEQKTAAERRELGRYLRQETILGACLASCVDCTLRCCGHTPGSITGYVFECVVRPGATFALCCANFVIALCGVDRAQEMMPEAVSAVNAAENRNIEDLRAMGRNRPVYAAAASIKHFKTNVTLPQTQNGNLANM